MHPLELTGDRIFDLSILFGLLTAGAGIITLVLYLVFARLIREEADESSGQGPVPSGLAGSSTTRPAPEWDGETTPTLRQPTAHGTPDPRPGRRR